MIKGTLPSKESIIILVDSGASSSLICAKTIQASQFLSQLPKREAPALKFTVGNGEQILTKYAMNIPLSIAGEAFNIEVRTVDTLGGPGLILGTDSLTQLDAKLDFKSHQLHFKSNSVNVNVCHDVSFKPGETKVIQIKGKLPNFMKNNVALIKTCKFATNFAFPRMLVQFHKCKANVLVYNSTQRIITLYKQAICNIVFQ